MYRKRYGRGIQEKGVEDTYWVDEIVGENPEVNSDVPDEEPNDSAYNSTSDEEDKEVPGYVPDAESEPLWPHSKQEEEEGQEDHES